MKKLLILTCLCGLLLPDTSHAMCKKRKKNKTEARQQNTLEGTWTLSYLEGGDMATLYKGKIPSITFDVTNKKVNGNNGCNSFFGPITLDGSSLAFSGPMGSTKMFCPGAGEQQFMEALAKVRSFSFHGPNEIDLIRGDIGVMRLQRK
ncbi:MAG TPA: META domain-containing protein [Chitinophagaceae bacterium]|nr:META domain-containing protein [Chitinophagaceae bacterium]